MLRNVSTRIENTQNNYYSFLSRKIVVNIIDGNKRRENERMSYWQCFRPSGVRLFRKESPGTRSLTHRRNSDPDTSHLKVAADALSTSPQINLTYIKL